jgi:hypothetical protein
VCSPLKNATDRRAATTNASPASTVTTQPTPAQTSVASSSDAAASTSASMMRTYITLGIKPPATLAAAQDPASNAITSRFNGLAAVSDTPSPSASVSSADGCVRPAKAWHHSVGQELRNHLVYKLYVDGFCVLRNSFLHDTTKIDILSLFNQLFHLWFNLLVLET